jgi:hypothetical protein
MFVRRLFSVARLTENALRRGSVHVDRRLVILFSSLVSGSRNASQCCCVSGEDRADSYTFSPRISGEHRAVSTRRSTCERIRFDVGNDRLHGDRFARAELAKLRPEPAARRGQLRPAPDRHAAAGGQSLSRVPLSSALALLRTSTLPPYRQVLLSHAVRHP